MVANDEPNDFEDSSKGFRCKLCGGECKVDDSRKQTDRVRRRRKCKECRAYSFHTREVRIPETEYFYD